jgi:thiol:disulfide interchange protein DsbD
MHILRGLFLVLLLALPGWAQFNLALKGPKTTARLVLANESARPGETVMAAVELTMDPGWHTYWVNGGDSGDGTQINWAATPGLSFGEILWPVPEKYVAEDLTTYVFHDRAILLLPITVAADAAPGPRELSALVSWLECEKACVPGSNMVSARLVIGTESKPAADAAIFKEAAARLPDNRPPGTFSIRWETPTPTNRPFVIEWNAAVSEPEFFAYTNAAATIKAGTEVVSNRDGKIVLRKILEKSGANWPAHVAGLLVHQVNGTNVGHEVTLKFPEGTTAAASAGTGAPAPKFFWAILVFAFLGGAILNVMPCVLPVIALKILGFVSQSRENPLRIRTLGIWYTLGVLASFLLLALVIIAARLAGNKAGWGIQFSNPPFLVGLTVLVTFVAMNLFGIFEVTLSSNALSAAGQAASKHGNTGAFMNGVLATILATPCTAPFLGAAAGFALAPDQPAALTILVFLTIGLGMAVPYLLLCWNSKWLRFLPRPGPWMERFKIIMGFPMLATAVWLFSLTIAHYGNGVVWIGVFLVVAALAAWIFGEFFQRGTKRRGIALGVALILLVAGYVVALEQQLDWRTPPAETDTGAAIPHSKDGIAWQRWSHEAVSKARVEGRVVFVDFTADWCLTCKANMKSSINIPSTRAKLKEINAVPLLGDYTKFPPVISAELQKFQRAGVPLVLVYPKDASKPPIVLPELLTPGIVHKALDEAAGR